VIGIIEGHVGSIRFFGILRRFRGLCLGQRILKKCEEMIFQQYNCIRVLVSLPSCRESMMNWIEKREYIAVSEIAYPFQALGHQLKKEKEIKEEKEQDKNSVTLIQFVKTSPSFLKKKSTKTEQPAPASDSSAAGPVSESYLPPVFRKVQPTAADCPHNNDDSEEEREQFGVD
jgi:hypothetical protein